MATADKPSRRLVEQRVRNRTIEALDALAAGADGIRAMGVVEYVEEFFDVVNDDAPSRWKENSAFTPEEAVAIDRVQQLLRQAALRHRVS